MISTCAALCACGTLEQIPAQETRIPSEEPEIMIENLGPTESEIVLESIRTAENPWAERQERFDAKVLLIGAVLDGKLEDRALIAEVVGFIERNAISNDLEEIRVGCVYAMGILGEWEEGYTGRSLAVLERALDDDSVDIGRESMERLEGIAASANGRQFADRIVSIFESALGNPGLAETAVFSLSDISEGFEARTIGRIVSVLINAASNPELVCPVWISLEDLTGMDNVDASLIRRMDSEGMGIDWSYQGVSCSEWFSSE